MNFAHNPRVVATMPRVMPGPFSTERGPNGLKGRVERAGKPSYRSSPYDDPNSNADVRGIGTAPYGQQSKFRPTITNASLPRQPGPMFAQIPSLYDGRPFLSFGGTSQQYVQQLQNAILTSQGLRTNQFGGARGGNPDMTSEVAGDQGYSTYSGFALPNMFAKFDGAPSSTPDGWGMTQAPRPTGSQLSLPNTGADGASDGTGMFTNVRTPSGTIQQVDPFSLATMREATDRPIRDGIDQNTNQPMVMALLAMKPDSLKTLGSQVAFDETQEGQLIYQAIEDNGAIQAAINQREGTIDGEFLPRTVFNVVAANWWLAQENKSQPLRGWKPNDVLSKIGFHGAIRGDVSARFGPGEAYGLARRLVNCNLGGGIESIFNEWGSVEPGWRLYHILKRVPHDKIRANPQERPGSYSLTASSENVIVVSETKTKNPFQIVPWVGKSAVHRPTRDDAAYYNDDNQIEYGVVIFVGIVFDVKFASPWQSQLDHCGTNASIRVQLPLIDVKIVGDIIQV